MTRRRPLRSVLIGDVDWYPSEYIFGVNQGMTLLGHWHRTVNVRADIDVIARVVEQVQPDVIWGHMLLWPPAGLKHAANLRDLCRYARQRFGSRVIIHDGDARTETRFPADISDSVDVVLCNHTADRSAWGVKQVRWPYFAFVQHSIAPPSPDLLCSLAFAGRLSESGIYAERTTLVRTLQQRLREFRVLPDERLPHHTLMRTPEIAASAQAVLGYGRPESPGWLDVRLFQYPGAGGVLLYDDVERASTYLEPFEHFIPYVRHDVASILDAVTIAQSVGEEMRVRAFAHVQQHHNSVRRVEQALKEIGL